MVETAEWVGPARAPARAKKAEDVQEERCMEEVAARAQEVGARARPPQEEAADIEEIEEIATEHMEISMEMNSPEPISLEVAATGCGVAAEAVAAVPSSQLAPLAQEGMRSAALSAVERLRAAGAWRCDSVSCRAVGNAPWQPCKGCGKKKPVGAMVGALTAAVAVLKQPLDVTAALAVAEAGADPTQVAEQVAYGMGAVLSSVAYAMGARAGCAAGMKDATEQAPLPAAFRDCDVALLLGGPQEEPKAVKRFADTSAVAAHMKKRRRDDDGDDDGVDTARITRRLVEPQPTARREPQMPEFRVPRIPVARVRRPSDWDCGYCGKLVFGSKVACFH